MANTPHLNITLVTQSQSQKEVTINLAFQVLEALQNTGIISMALSAPPGSPAEGALYVVKATGSGAWLGQDGNLAYFINGGWLFITPLNGLTLYDLSQSLLVTYSSGSWISPDSTFAILGVNASADSTNKLTVGSAAILFKDIGGNVQVKISKHSSSDTASMLFQDNTSSRAEMGCIGSDDFQLKVSNDGTTFFQSWVITATSGAVDFKQEVSFDKNLTSTVVGKTLVLKLGSNGKAGTITLTGATPVSLGNTSITANSNIHFTLKTVGGTVGAYPTIQTITPGTGCTVAGTAGDTSTYNYTIIESA